MTPIKLTVNIYHAPSKLTAKQVEVAFKRLLHNLQWEDFGGEALQWFNDRVEFDVKARRWRKGEAVIGTVHDD